MASSTMKTRALECTSGRSDERRVATHASSAAGSAVVSPPSALPRWSSCALVPSAGRARPVGRGSRASSSQGGAVGLGRAVRGLSKRS
eukprot:scaffold121013_cov26-Tisochrysis_lutea.AAC.1